MIERSLPEGVLNDLVSNARAHGCTFYSAAYAASVLATVSVNRPERLDNIALLRCAIPVSLRHKDILTRDVGLQAALGFNVLVCADLGRFLHDSHHISVADIWALGREVSAQLKAQRSAMDTVALWGEWMSAASVPPDVAIAMARYAFPMDLSLDFMYSAPKPTE